jgi:ribosomal protein S18 acetylase RimI-like enzyme
VSLYGDYLRERTNDHILETGRGFATYRFVENAVYIVDIYVVPQFRKSGEASQMADAIAKAAKEQGCTKMLGSVVPSMKGSLDSVKVLLAYGMRPVSAREDFIVFEKEI